MTSLHDGLTMFLPCDAGTLAVVRGPGDPGEFRMAYANVGSDPLHVYAGAIYDSYLYYVRPDVAMTPEKFIKIILNTPPKINRQNDWVDLSWDFVISSFPSPELFKAEHRKVCGTSHEDAFNAENKVEIVTYTIYLPEGDHPTMETAIIGATVKAVAASAHEVRIDSAPKIEVPTAEEPPVRIELEPEAPTTEESPIRIGLDLDKDLDEDAEGDKTTWSMTMYLVTGRVTNRWRFDCPGSCHSRAEWDAVVEGKQTAYIAFHLGNSSGGLMVSDGQVKIDAMLSGQGDDMHTECTFPHEWLAGPLRVALLEADALGYKFLHKKTYSYSN